MWNVTTALPNMLIAGRYTLQPKIGEGGMGEVRVAKQSEPVSEPRPPEAVDDGTRQELPGQRADRNYLSLCTCGQIGR